MAPALASIAQFALVSTAAAEPASLGRVLDRHWCDLVDRLERIAATRPSTSRDRFIAIQIRGRPAAYVQCLFEPGNVAVRCEAASGAHDRTVGADQPPGDATRLAALGFDTGRPGRNYERRVPLGAPPDLGSLADLMLTALHDGYGLTVRDGLAIRAPIAPDRRRLAACTPMA